MGLRLGDILIEKRMITPQELKMAVEEHKRTKGMLGQILIKMGLLTEKRLLQVLAEQQGMPFVDLKEITIEDKVIKHVPAKFAWHYKVMPIKLEGNVLYIALSNPFDMWPLDDLETNLGYRVEVVLSTSSSIFWAIRKYYGIGSEAAQRTLAIDPSLEFAPKDEAEDLEAMAEDSSVIKLVGLILEEAVSDKATDLHFECFKNELSLRYKIDGILYDKEISNDTKSLYPVISARLKAMAGLDTAEHRFPQDGKAKIKIDNNEYNLLISTIPAAYGENIIIRIIPSAASFKISDLGMSVADGKTLEGFLVKPGGIVFISGPAESGKSTTAYACLNLLNARNKKIITVEDPIKFELRGISQIQIERKIDLDFTTALRTALKHQPDVLMIGEIRDQETAEVAIQAALGGAQVFSIIRTNDTVSAVTRIMGMGIEPILIASSSQALINQRLVRMVCHSCKEKLKVKGGELKIDQFVVNEEMEIYKGKGCNICRNTGYFGRTGIFEILPLTEGIKKMIIEKASPNSIRTKAIELGMKTLEQDGWDKVSAGITTPEELIRVI